MLSCAFLIYSLVVGARGSLCRVVQTWQRTRQVSDLSRIKEVTERKFRYKHQCLGYTPQEIDAKFQKASSAKMVKAGLARKVGGKWYVCMPKAREFTSADVMSMSLQGNTEDMYCSSAQKKNMLHGRQDIQLSDAAKKSAFQGITNDSQSVSQSSQSSQPV